MSDNDKPQSQEVNKEQGRSHNHIGGSSLH